MFRLVRNTPFSYKNDILSGIVNALCAIAYIIVICNIIGVDYRYGIIGFCLSGVLSSAFGARAGMISGPNLLMAMICYPLVAKFGLQYLFAATIIAGLLQFIYALLRLGKYIRVLPRSVILGSIAGVVLLEIFRMALQLRRPTDDGFFEYITSSEIAMAAVFFAVGLTIIIYLPRFFKLLPASLSTLVFFILLFIPLKKYTESIFQFSERNEWVENSFDTLKLLDLPPLNFETLQIILPYALMLFITGVVSSLTLLSFTDELTNTRGKATREMRSLSLTNILCGVLGGVPVAGSIPLTMVNLQAGGKGRIVNLVTAILVGSVVFVEPLQVVVEYVPVFACLSLITIILIETFIRASFYQFKKLRFFSAIILISVAAVTVMFNLVIAILTGIIISFIVFAWENARRIRVRKRIDDQGVKYYEIYGPLFFASVPVFNQKFEIEEDPNEIVLDFLESKVLDYEGAKALFKLIERYRKEDKKVKLKFISSDLKRLIYKEKIDVEIIEGGEDDPTYTILVDEFS